MSKNFTLQCGGVFDYTLDGGFMSETTLLISDSTSVLEFTQFLKREFSLHPRCSMQSLKLSRDAVFSSGKQKSSVFEIDKDTLAAILIAYLKTNYKIELEIRNDAGIKVAGDTRMSEGRDMQLTDEASTQTLQGCISTAISLGNTLNYSSIDQIRGVFHRGNRFAINYEDRSKLIDAVVEIANNNKTLPAHDIVGFLSIVCCDKADYEYSVSCFEDCFPEVVELIVSEANRKGE